MITVAFRSSSIGTYKLCAGRFYLDYVLGFPNKSGKKAAKGSLFHKVMECLAHKKKCQQDGVTSFEDDLDGEIHIDECTPELLFNRFKNHYAEESRKDWENTEYEKKETWTKIDFTHVEKWLESALTLDGGRYDPRNQNIVAVERFFDMPLPFDWAKYNFTVNGQTLEGQLQLRGSVDLIVDRGYDFLIRDYKTGSMTDFSKKPFREKTYAQLCEEFQFRLYTWVARQFYPDVKLSFEAFFAQYAGPYELYIDDTDGERAVDHMRVIFKKIVNTQFPTFVKNTSNDGPCVFCTYRKLKGEDGRTLCDNYEEQLIQLGGADKMFEKLGNISKLSQYSGGGKNLILDKD